jgi:HK97 family phage portal protein
MPTASRSRGLRALSGKGTASTKRGKKKAASYSAVASSFSSLGYVEDDGESYERLLKKYGKSTAWVYIAVNRIANATAQVRPTIAKANRRGQPNSVVSGPAGGLRDLLARPNPVQSWFDFIESIMVHLELTGNAFIEKASFDRFGRPHALFPLNPSRVTVVPGRKGVEGYIYDVNSNRVGFKPEEVMHIRYAHPCNDWYGLSPLSAARLSIDVDKGSLEWNRNFMGKGAWPAGAVETANDLDDTTVRRLKAELKRVVNRGKDGVGQILLLTGGLKYHPIAISPKDLDWLDARRMSRDEILGIYGVPFAVAGLYSNESTTARSAGVSQQVINFYLFTVFPKLEKVYAALNRELTPLFPGELEIAPDVRSVVALKDDVQKDLVRAQAFRTLVASGWSVEMALAELYPHVKTPAWGSVWWANQAMIPIDGPENTTVGNTDQPESPGGDVPTDPMGSDDPVPDTVGGKAQQLLRSLGVNSGADVALRSLVDRYGIEAL